MNWCWYTEGGCFESGFASRQEAVNAAFRNEQTSALVGTSTSPGNAAADAVDAEDVAESLMNGPFAGIETSWSVREGGQEALADWARKYLECDFTELCINGTDPTPKEWEAARLAAEVPEKAGAK